MTETLLETAVRRTFFAGLDQMEWRQHANGTDMTLEGHAAVFDKWSEELWAMGGSFREKIAPGAFSSVLRMCGCCSTMT
jgi:phage head maturation protease